MNQQELHELLEELEGMLREVGLMSVVEQEQQAAAEGRSVEEQGGRRGESGSRLLHCRWRTEWRCCST